MDVNATLIIQMLVFITFIWVTVRYIWPPLIKALETRRQTIADGLAAAEEARHALALAEIQVKAQLAEAKVQASQMLEQANERASHVIAEAKVKAREEGEHLLQLAKNEITQEYNTAKAQLMKQISTIAVAGAEKILQREVDKASNDRLVDELVSEM
jgi:F-type H+-transporting ATPase subunit b